MDPLQNQFFGCWFYFWFYYAGVCPQPGDDL